MVVIPMPPGTDIDRLPVKGGFRQRGMEMTRIETFTDAAFAFALTLLVLSSNVPESLTELLRSIRNIPVFIFGAANLMVFWHGHNEWSRRFGLDDFRTMILSVALVCTILIYVYPLRYVGGLFVSFVGAATGLPIGPEFKAGFDVGDINRSFIIYGAGFAANGIVLILLNLHAYRNRDALSLNEEEQFLTKSEMGAWSILCAVGLVSALIGALLPEAVGAPGMAYMLLPILMPIYGRAMLRKQKNLERDPSHGEILNVLTGKDSERG